ncbi:DUF2167 domain-containing protein [Pelagibaculum spongiae]|uniref:DUF2167 domain-containing protein n=2 Tax=Pelagibaculum spongiae TaxID=2080658 RepID=A0A2V1H7V7_9GAMM|nr:DUF2167 domain-containing protein [Pelagibaculum spongiae]
MAQQESDSGITQEQQQEMQRFVDSINWQQGEIKLLDGAVTLNVGSEFYYLSPADAEKILVELWGNIPGAGSQSVGMIFPSDVSPYEQDSWASIIQYEEDGYVSDEDAADINYDELLGTMQDDTRESSKRRTERGYGTVELIGWASRPYYDSVNKKLHWAKEMRFDGSEAHTLNYNIRVLGRKGVLVLNFIAGMDQLDQINGSVDKVLRMAEFNQGDRYQDFDPDIDEIAAYGIGALVAGKVIAKTGLLAGLFILLKKFGIIGLVALAGLFGKFFKKKK